MFDDALENLGFRPGRVRHQSLRTGVAVDPVFDLSEDHFHEKSLRAGPTAPEPAKSRCEDNDRRKEQEHSDGEDDSVLRPEDLSEDGEPSLDDVEHQEGIAVDSDEWPGEHDRQQDPTDPRAPLIEAAVRLFGIEPASFSGGIRCAQVIAEVLPIRGC